MLEPRALKINIKDSVKDDGNYYIFNDDDSTAIRVPKGILKTINKINNLPNRINHIFVDVLATSINKRRLEDVTEELNNWINDGIKPYYYPECKANSSFAKLIDTFFKSLCIGYLSEEEVRQLIFFFATCPHGYDVSELIRAHYELNPVIT